MPATIQIAHKIAVVLLLACVLMAVLGPGARAQDYRGKVSGTVTDPTGAVIVGATVRLTNTGTGISSAKQTGETGRYDFEFVEPGSYSVQVEKSGFKQWVHANVTVEVRADVTVNAALSVGSAGEQVTVTTDVVPVKFNTSTVDLTIDRKMLTDLPILGRNPFRLSLLDPLVVDEGWGANNPFDMWGAQTIDIAGSTTEKNDILLDGVPLTMTNKSSYAPPMDAVQEFTIQTTGVDAEYGNSSGGSMNLSMKSGTNDFHGTAYYFGRNPALNAISDRTVDPPVKNFVHNHTWGGTLGNPIIKNKLFTFTAWEQWRTKDPRTLTATMPTDLERIGDFSQSLNADGTLRVIYDPWTTREDPANPGMYIRDPFPFNIIPPERIDPTAQRIMESVWRPNNPGVGFTGQNNFRETYQWTTNYWNFSHRTDWNITDKWRVFGRYSQFHNIIGENHTVDSPAMPNDEGGQMFALNLAGDAVYTMNERTIFNIRGSYGSIHDDYYDARSQVSQQDLSALWPNDWFTPYTRELPAIYYPRVQVLTCSDIWDSGCHKADLGHRETWFEHPRNASLSFKVFQSLGRHNLKYGVSWRRNWGMINYPYPMQFNFDPADTADTFQSPDTNLSGDGWASFLLGAMTSDSNAAYISPADLHINSWALYIHNDVKVTQKLTLNLGLRWEYETAPVDTKDRISRYLDLTDPIPEMQGGNAPVIPSEVTDIAAIPYKWNGAWVFSSSGHRGMFNTSKRSFMPRVGFAYAVSDKTSLRGGYARYVIPVSLTQPLQPTQDYSIYTLYGYTAETYVMSPLVGIPRVTLADPFPANYPLTLPQGKSLGRYQNLGDNANWALQNLKTGVSERINFSLQHMLPAQFALDLNYYLNYSYNLPRVQQLNMMDPRLSYEFKDLLDQSVPNPFFDYLTPDVFPGPLRYEEEVSIGRLLRPYPQYGDLGQQFVSDRKSIYHALLIRLQRQFSKGASALASYSYVRQKDTEFFGDVDQYLSKYTYIPSSMPRHRLSVSGSYDLPIGHGRQLFSGMHPMLNAIIGGWSTTGIFTWNTGAFARFDWGVQVADPLKDKPAGYYWNPNFLEPIPEGTYADRTNPWQYPGVTGPNNWNIDAALSKFVPLKGERLGLEIKLEAYNLTNSKIPSFPYTDIGSELMGFSDGMANRGRECQYTLRLRF